MEFDEGCQPESRVRERAAGVRPGMLRDYVLTVKKRALQLGGDREPVLADPDLGTWAFVAPGGGIQLWQNGRKPSAAEVRECRSMAGARGRSSAGVERRRGMSLADARLDAIDAEIRWSRTIRSLSTAFANAGFRLSVNGSRASIESVR